MRYACNSSSRIWSPPLPAGDDAIRGSPETLAPPVRPRPADYHDALEMRADQKIFVDIQVRAQFIPSASVRMKSTTEHQTLTWGQIREPNRHHAASRAEGNGTKVRLTATREESSGTTSWPKMSSMGTSTGSASSETKAFEVVLFLWPWALRNLYTLGIAQAKPMRTQLSERSWLQVPRVGLKPKFTGRLRTITGLPRCGLKFRRPHNISSQPTEDLNLCKNFLPTWTPKLRK